MNGAIAAAVVANNYRRRRREQLVTDGDRDPGPDGPTPPVWFQVLMVVAVVLFFLMLLERCT